MCLSCHELYTFTVGDGHRGHGYTHISRPHLELRNGGGNEFGEEGTVGLVTRFDLGGPLSLQVLLDQGALSEEGRNVGLYRLLTLIL